MLQELIIKSTASYGLSEQRLVACKKINFVFGTNGSGKTTISRVIADPIAHPTCALTWANGRELECVVYNTDFVTRNFNSNLPGIFTLGEDADAALTQIRDKKAEQDRVEADILTKQVTLDGGDGSGGKIGELLKLRADFEEQCWLIKGRHDEHFRDVFQSAGVRGAKARFCDKVLEEQSNNTGSVCDLADLKSRAQTVFQEGLARQTELTLPNAADLIALESDPILTKKVVGKEDVDVAALITRLGNSDWVKEGRGYLAQSGTQCPFCQQALLTDIAASLNEYFDETYILDIAEIERLQQAYATYSDALKQRLEALLALDSKYLDNTALRAEADLIAQRIELNIRQLERKKKEPSAVVVLEGLSPVATAIGARVTAANQAIARHNELVNNIATERTALIADAWKFLLEESSATIAAYLTAKGNLDSAVTGLKTGMGTKNLELARLKGEIVTLEQSITSVQPTVNAINGILTSFGFTGFSLATAGESNNLYQIVRADGTDATRTLSEGEKGFITFLYFYHLIRGSVSESGMTTDRVVVFDDPVSSLDSDVLFIVGTLIKRVLEEACEGNGQIKQVFVLTHNIYFHKEVSFDSKRGEVCRHHETFWIVRKQNGESEITGYDHNPIKTSYELLWSEVRNPNRSKLTIQNTLRRILENYFKILGNLDKDDIVAKFEGRDQQICGSLFSWVNDGSHAVHDDLYISSDDSVVNRYLDVFKQIFDKTNHTAHYNMMMGVEAVEDSTDTARLAA